LVLLGLLWLPAQSASAAPKYGNSLDLVPADAAFYSASLRLREQFDIVAKSNAWAKLKNLPSVQMAWQLAQFGLNQPGGPGDQITEFFTDPDNKELRDLLIDAVSSEVFVYGDRSAADFVDIGLRTVNAVQYASIVDDLQDDENVSARIVLNSLDANRERLNAPGLIFGFKLSDKKRAQNQLARLEKIAKPILDEEPQFRGRLKRMTVGNTEVLMLDLDGSMVPWDEVPWKDLAEKPGQYDALQEKLKKMRVTVAIGVQDGYLLVAVGDTPARLAALGQGKLLAETLEVKPLEKFVAERLIHISFASKAMLQAMTDTNRNLDQLVQVVRQVLPEAGLSEDLNKRILKDAEELAGDLKGVMPEPGAQFSFSFLKPQGVEGYHYDWSQNLYADGSKPLDLLDHVGGSPLLALVGRTKYSPQQYESFRKWTKKAFGYFEELAIPEFSDEEQEQYKKVKEAVLPLVARLDTAAGQMLLPALADGQAALVLDAKLMSKHWFENLPQGDRELPMLEAALVFGVSDAALLTKACTEYRAITEAAIEKAKQLFPDDVPADFQLPQAEKSEVKTSDGTASVYWYKLPGEIGIDPQLTPNAGVSQHVAVLSLAPKHTERLLGNAPLVVTPGGPLADRKKPLAAAVFFNWAGLVDAATPWVDLLAHHIAAQGVEGAGLGLALFDAEARANLAAADDDNGPSKMIMDQVHTVLDVLKVLRTVESATSVENGALVTHSLTVIQDVN
jgi:hypothetical protein